MYLIYFISQCRYFPKANQFLYTVFWENLPFRTLLNIGVFRKLSDINKVFFGNSLRFSDKSLMFKSLMLKLLLIFINPFWPNVPFSYPLKIQIFSFSEVFKGYRNGKLAYNGLIFVIRYQFWIFSFPVGKCMFQVNNRNTRQGVKYVRS